MPNSQRQTRPIDQRRRASDANRVHNTKRTCDHEQRKEVIMLLSRLLLQAAKADAEQEVGDDTP